MQVLKMTRDLTSVGLVHRFVWSFPAKRERADNIGTGHIVRVPLLLRHVSMFPPR